ncbi:MAG: LysM peptidoglycan-binding domain-containing protein [Candidatus Moranbacteria bacterium]|nr:LysM peptidoglycan-binding domain-containing protein [Candidatus Moranbacteria bacterium]
MVFAFSKPVCQSKGFSLISKKSFFSHVVDFIKKINASDINTKIHLRQRAIADYIKQHRTLKLLHLLRNYSAIAVVVSSALLVSATNVASGKGSGSFIFGYWDENAQVDGIMTGKISGQISRKDDLALVPLSKSNNAVDPMAKDEAESQNLIKNQGIMSASLASPMKDPEEDGGVKMYVVVEGDTLGSIAAKNKVSVNTILWANDIDNVDSIMPGDTLFILPVSGIKYVVKAGDNIDFIALKFKAEKGKIIAFNDLPANGDLEIGEEIVIPDGQGEAPKPAMGQSQSDTGGTSIIEKRQYANASGGVPEVSTGVIPKGKVGTGHKFPYGYCTWYVAQKRYVPWGGNAGTWLYHAKAGGYATGRAPRVGSIMVTTENRYYGHVAYVEKVSGDTITVSEMNYVGFAKRSSRTISASSRAIKGFIY